MKKFELYSAEFVSKYGKPKSVMSIIEANSYAEVIQEIESNAGGVLVIKEVSKFPISRRLWNEED